MKNASVKTASVFASDFKTDSSLNFYVKRVSKFPVLSAEEEKELARLSSLGNDDAKKRLIQANLRLVINIARK